MKTYVLLIPVLLLGACSDAGPSLDDRNPIEPPSREGFGSTIPQEGYLLISPLQSRSVFLVDREGETHYRWETEWEPGNSVYLTERGTLLRAMRIEEDVAFVGGGIGGGIQEIAADGTVLWEYRMADEARHHHHDFEPLPNGNILLLAWVKYTAEEALARGRDPELLRGEEFWPDSIFEIKPVGTDGAEIVWEWHTWDHLIQDFDAEAEHYGVVAEHPERIDINGDREPVLKTEEELDAELDALAAMGYAGGDADDTPTTDAGTPGDAIAHWPKDGGQPEEADAEKEEEDKEPTAKELLRAKTRDADWMHTNGIDYHAGLDQIAISVRTFNEVWILDHSTTTAEAASSSGGRYGKGGDLLYRWGNPSAYGMGHAEDRVLYRQHDVQWIEEGSLGAGGLILFNNGRDRPDEEYSSIEEWWPPRNEAGAYLLEEGAAYGPTASTWTYTAPVETDFYSSFISGVQRLPNGNTLITSGKPGRVFEVHPNGTIVWDWNCDLVTEEESTGDGKGPVGANSLFRVTWIPADHPGLQGVLGASE